MDRPHGDRRRYIAGPDEDGTEGKGCRCTPCRDANNAYDRHRRRQAAYGRWEGLVDATGTRRRVEALMWHGWSLGALAARRGVHRNSVMKVLRYSHVSPSTAATYRALYAEVWRLQPPSGTPRERQDITMARRYAREHGFVPLAAWDEDQIGDPDASPVPGWDREARQAPSGSLAVAAAIREARAQAKLSRPRLAAVMRVSASAVKMWEDGERTPTEENWVQLELTLGPLGVVREGSRSDGDGEDQQRGEESDAA